MFQGFYLLFPKNGIRLGRIQLTLPLGANFGFASKCSGLYNVQCWGFSLADFLEELADRIGIACVGQEGEIES
jgi:hypothetical protein